MPCKNLFLRDLPDTYGGDKKVYGTLDLPLGCFCAICTANRLIRTDCPKDKLKYKITPHCWRVKEVTR